MRTITDCLRVTAVDDKKTMERRTMKFYACVTCTNNMIYGEQEKTKDVFLICFSSVKNPYEKN